jgi:hypothetical protein
MDWTAVEAEKDSSRKHGLDSGQFDEVMGGFAESDRATAWTGQRSSSMRSWAKLLLRERQHGLDSGRVR